MITSNISLCIVKAPSEKIIFSGYVILDFSISEKKAYPILWCNSGLFCLIPREVVQNAIVLSKIFQEDWFKRTPPTICFTWDQGVPVDNKVGRILMGE